MTTNPFGTPTVTVNLSAARALTDQQAAAAYRVLVAGAKNQPNQPVALSVHAAADAVTSLNLATTAQLSAGAPASAAPDSTVAAQAQMYRLGELEKSLAQRATDEQDRAAAAEKAQTRAALKALGLTSREEDHR